MDTILQNKIIRLLCIKANEKLNQREIAKILKVSPTAVAKALKGIKNIIKIEKQYKINLNLVSLDRDNTKTIELKRAENLKQIYESNLLEYLHENFPGTDIVLFGSYSRGEDIYTSDIDIAIIGAKNKKLDLKKYEKQLERKINVNMYIDIKSIDNNIINNIINGITLKGAIDI